SVGVGDCQTANVLLPLYCSTEAAGAIAFSATGFKTFDNKVHVWISYNHDGVAVADNFFALVGNDRNHDNSLTNVGNADDQLFDLYSTHAGASTVAEGTFCMSPGVVDDDAHTGKDWQAGQVVIFVGAYVDAVGTSAG